jgi:CCR4-NOT transcriptional regulation complex NOT5 subunit
VPDLELFCFDFLRGSTKLTTDILLYMFYNILDESYQLYAAEKL